MYLQRLRLEPYRNHPKRVLEAGPGIHLLLGPNGSGKTNVLEAIHLLALARGFGADRDAIPHTADLYCVEGEFGPPGQAFLVLASQHRTGPKRLLLNGQAISPLSRHLGRVPVVSILPEDVLLVDGAPADRRRWLDALGCQADGTYLQALQRYQRALEQRNSLLRQAEAAPPDATALAAWDEAMIEPGLQLQHLRRSLLAQLEPHFAALHTQVVQGPPPQLHYVPNLDTHTPEGFRQRLAAGRARDLAAGRSLVGPHRDDVDLLLQGHPLRSFGSQGQRKTVVVALKLAQALLLQAHTGKPPLLLLDDLFDRLDPQRTLRIAQWLLQAPNQVFISHPEAQRLQQVFAQAAENHSGPPRTIGIHYFGHEPPGNDFAEVAPQTPSA